ncbi:MAG: Gmad2 immunoglobulin-like domain-containing protein [Rubrobacteraceae bacterium]
MAGFPPISVRQPRPHDLVDDPVKVCGIGTGFEGVFHARVRDGKGAELKEVTINAGGTGILGNFQISINIPGAPSTARGTLEVFEVSQNDNSEINKRVVPIVFGKVLIDPYHGFAQHEVESGETLSEIAAQFYGDPQRWRRIFAANRDQIEDPEVIVPGQALRIPQ